MNLCIDTHGQITVGVIPVRFESEDENELKYLRFFFILNNCCSIFHVVWFSFIFSKDVCTNTYQCTESCPQGTCANQVDCEANSGKGLDPDKIILSMMVCWKRKNDKISKTKAKYSPFGFSMLKMHFLQLVHQLVEFVSLQSNLLIMYSIFSFIGSIFWCQICFLFY